MTLEQFAEDFDAESIFKDWDTFFEVCRQLSIFASYGCIHKLDIPDNAISEYVDWVMSDNTELSCDKDDIKNLLLKYKTNNPMFLVNIFNDIDSFQDFFEQSLSNWSIDFCNSSSDNSLKLQKRIDELLSEIDDLKLRSSRVVDLEEQITELLREIDRLKAQLNILLNKDAIWNILGGE